MSPHHPSVDAPRPARPPVAARHVVVIGASMAGLPVAAAVARHARRVTLIERDDLPDGIDRRPGVPQARHAHALQVGGRLALERLLPGITDEWLAAGAAAVSAEDLLVHSGAGWFPRADVGQPMICGSRDLIEAVVRRRVLDLPNVEVRDGTEVTELVTGRSGDRVTGVRVRPRQAPGWPSETIEADLVIDASGRRSHAPFWLESLGYGRPVREEVDAKVVYSTRLYARNPAARREMLVMLPHVAHGHAGAFVTPIEDDRWMVTLSGTDGAVPGTDPAALGRFSETLPAPLVRELIGRAEALSPIWAYYRTSNVRHRFDRMSGWPAGFSVVGDAACAFNPTYGQGMSVAALTASAIDDVLADTPARDAAEPIQRQTHRISSAAWLLATGQDRRYPGSTGAKHTWRDRIVDRYFDRLARVSAIDARVRLAFRKVIGMVAAPPSLFHPAIVLRVLRPRSIPTTPAPATTIGLADSAAVGALADAAA